MSRPWTPGRRGRAAWILFGCALVLSAGPVQAGDRLGWTLAGSLTRMRDEGALRDWVDYTAMSRGIDFGKADKEFGGSFGATIFKDRSARAGLEVFILLSSTTGRDAARQKWVASNGHIGVDIFYAVNLIRPPGPLIPYLGGGLGSDVPFFNLNYEGRDTTDVPGSVFASGRLGYASAIVGLDCFLPRSFAFGLRAKYLMGAPGTLHVSDAYDKRLKGRNLPNIQSLIEHPDDPSRWQDMHYNRSAFIVSIQLTFHQRLLKAPGVTDD